MTMCVCVTVCVCDLCVNRCVCVWPISNREDPENKGRKYPPRKKDETEEERKLRRSLKKLARKTETPEERQARKAAKSAKKLRKSQRRQSAVPGGISSVGGTEAPTTESQMGGGSDDSSD